MGGGASKGGAEDVEPGAADGELVGVMPVPKKQEAMGTPASALPAVGNASGAVSAVQMGLPTNVKPVGSSAHLENRAMLNLLRHPEHCNTLVRLIRERIR